ncbi:hypothetical protein QR98_0057480 [Sarcoptes scabiei]|uniref:Uncharacterized protein n=1 Tax=Sarcoptes scabiei TaxID=52283 RepID=A0A132A8R2_SARSC|nr:hypothetical protein QR98_0057480 [Sarcoptes scabiei]
MKISLEETLLNSSIPQTSSSSSSSQSSSSSTTQENVCDDSTKFDERQRTIIQQHEIERQKRKSFQT